MSSSKPLPGRCGSPLRKKPGEFCTEWPMRGKTRCYFHGGKSRSGPDHPNWKDGKYSRYNVPGMLTAHMERLRSDDNPLDLTEEIMLHRALLAGRLETLGSGESTKTWRRLVQAFEELLEANRTGDREAGALLFNEIHVLIQRGAAFMETVQDVIRQSEVVRRHVETETRRRVAESRAVTLEEIRVGIQMVYDLARMMAEQITAGKEPRKALSEFYVGASRIWGDARTAH